MADKTAKLTSKMSVYKEMSTKSAVHGTLKKGDKVTVTSVKNDSKGNTWAKTNSGWFMTYRKSNGKSFCTMTEKKNSNSAKSKNKKQKTVNVNNKHAAKQYQQLKKSLKVTTNNGNKLNKTMQLFGLPYQFIPSVDYRVDTVSDLVGRKYIEKVILQAPVVTILPGEPSYLPGRKDKSSITSAFIAAANGNLGALQTISAQTNIDNLKFYDFKTAYVKYMRYVNVMCRTCAAFLELQGSNKKANGVDYKINGKVANFMNFDWKNYRWSGQNYQSTAGLATQAATKATVNGVKSSAKKAYKTGKNAPKTVKSVYKQLSELGSSAIDFLVSTDAKTKYTTVSKAASKTISNAVKKSKKKKKKSGKTTSNYDITENELNLNDSSSGLDSDSESTIESLFRNVHYVQFYVDPSSDVSETIGNSTKESSLKSTFNTVSDTVKDIAFMANSGGITDTGKLGKLGESYLSKLTEGLSGAVGTVNDNAGSLLSRVFSTGKNIIKGDNVIMPDIYSNSDYSKSYNITIPLRAPYGNKFSIYMDVLVPMCFALGLVLPTATSANTFSAPFLVKCFMPGKFTCNMGIVTSCSIERNQDARNVDGLCQEITITLGITDLYSDLTMTPASDPILFCNNTSLVEYLAINCGLDLVDSQFSTKVSLLWNSVKDFATDIPDNVVSAVTEEMDSFIYSFTGL